MDYLCYVIFTISFLCFLYHTIAHILEHYKKISESRIIHIGIDISMFVGWFSYFWLSFSEFQINLSLANYAGLIILIIGFYLFIASGKKVHKRLHTGKGGLITDGVYKKIRHPMYFGQILMLIGGPVFGGSLIMLALSPLFIIQLLIWRYMEEKELMEEFGKEYEEYKKATWF